MLLFALFALVLSISASLVFGNSCSIVPTRLSPMQDGVTPLFQAANNGHTDCLRLFLENGADMEVKNNVRTVWFLLQ